ncbi:MAG TPA: Gfo/Idh/MocA family oxidoreductase [Opitutaceae bacterium]
MSSQVTATERLPQAARPQAGPPRVGLIGVSGYGRIHLQMATELQALGRLAITAAVVINPEEEAVVVKQLRDHGCRIYGSYEAMFRTEAGALDLCLIPTGIPWHTRMTIAALRAGTHVLVEKPLAGSLAEVEAIRAEERASGRVVAVGFQDIYPEETAWLKSEILAGAIGELRAIRVFGLWPRPASYFTRNGWAGRLVVDGVPVLDSPLNNAFAHFVNLALFLAGPELGVSSRAGAVEADLYRAHAIESFDTVTARARTAAGVLLWFGFSHSCRNQHDPVVEIEGSQGSARWRYEVDCSLTADAEEPRLRRLPDAQDSRRAMFSKVLRRLAGDPVLIGDTAQAACHTALIEAVHAAAPIRQISPDCIERYAPVEGASPIPVVCGLEDALRRAAASGRLLREVDFPAT